VKGQPASVGGLLVYNKRVVEEMMRETKQAGRPTMLVSTYVKEHFTDKRWVFHIHC
jgi:hypothetical protein